MVLVCVATDAQLAGRLANPKDATVEDQFVVDPEEPLP
jgi:hypothetical protein